jgi:hypothetical protein
LSQPCAQSQYPTFGPGRQARTTIAWIAVMLLRNSSLGFGAFGGRGKLLSPVETAGPSTALRSGRDDNSVEAGMEATEKSLSLQQKCHPDRKRTWVKQDRTQPSQRPAFFSFPSPRMECFFSESRMLFLNAITPGYKAFLVLERLQDSPSASAGPSVTPSTDERPHPYCKTFET